MLGLIVVGKRKGEDKKEAFPIESGNALKSDGGEGEIRTLGTGFNQYSGLANRRLRPLGNLSYFAFLPEKFL